MTSSNILCCPQLRDFQFTVKDKLRNQKKKFTSRKQEAENFWLSRKTFLFIYLFYFYLSIKSLSSKNINWKMAAWILGIHVRYFSVFQGFF